MEWLLVAGLTSVIEKSGFPIELVKMLVLSRKKNESIIIDDNIVITVVEVRGDKVRLGIEAPKEIPIHRSEIYDAIQRDKSLEKNATEEDAAEVSTGDL